MTSTLTKNCNPRDFLQLPESEREALLAENPGQLIIDLSHLTLVRISGEDAESFLQSQLSNDIESLHSNQAQLQAYCNPKGRVSAVVRLMKCRDGFWMLVPADLRDALLMRLKMYVLAHSLFLTSGLSACVQQRKRHIHRTQMI